MIWFILLWILLSVLSFNMLRLWYINDDILNISDWDWEAKWVYGVVSFFGGPLTFVISLIIFISAIEKIRTHKRH